MSRAKSPDFIPALVQALFWALLVCIPGCLSSGGKAEGADALKPDRPPKIKPADNRPPITGPR